MKQFLMKVSDVIQQANSFDSWQDHAVADWLMKEAGLLMDDRMLKTAQNRPSTGDIAKGTAGIGAAGIPTALVAKKMLLQNQIAKVLAYIHYPASSQLIESLASKGKYWPRYFEQILQSRFPDIAEELVSKLPDRSISNSLSELWRMTTNAASTKDTGAIAKIWNKATKIGETFRHPARAIARSPGEFRNWGAKKKGREISQHLRSIEKMNPSNSINQVKGFEEVADQIQSKRYNSPTINTAPTNNTSIINPEFSSSGQKITQETIETANTRIAEQATREVAPEIAQAVAKGNKQGLMVGLKKIFGKIISARGVMPALLGTGAYLATRDAYNIPIMLGKWLKWNENTISYVQSVATLVVSGLSIASKNPAAAIGAGIGNIQNIAQDYQKTKQTIQQALQNGQMADAKVAAQQQIDSIHQQMVPIYNKIVSMKSTGATQQQLTPIYQEYYKFMRMVDDLRFQFGFYSKKGMTRQQMIEWAKQHGLDSNWNQTEQPLPPVPSINPVMLGIGAQQMPS